MEELLQEGSVPEYSLVITSCGRFDLLRATIDSFLRYADAPPKKIIVTEDSGYEEVRIVFEGLKIPVRIFINRPQLGQMRSIDLAYSAVETEFVFHCEDDWEFIRGGFIYESFKVLNLFPKVSMVGLRDRAELNPRVRNSPPETREGISFFRMDPNLHPEYFSYGFNPGLRRMCDYRAFAPLSALGHEADVSYAFKPTFPR